MLTKELLISVFEMKKEDTIGYDVRERCRILKKVLKIDFL